MSGIPNAAWLVAVLTAGLLQPQAQAAPKQEASKQQPTAVRETLQKPGPALTPPDKPLSGPMSQGCYADFMDDAHPQTLQRHLGAQRLDAFKVHCVRPCCSCGHHHLKEPPKGTQLNETLPLPDRIIAGPGARIVVSRRLPGGISEEIGISGREEYKPDAFTRRTVQWVEIRCTAGVKQPPAER